MKASPTLAFNKYDYRVEFDHHAQPKYTTPICSVSAYDSGIVTITSSGGNEPEWRQGISRLTRNTCSVLMVKEAGNLYTPDGEKVVKKYLQTQYLYRHYKSRPQCETTDQFNLWLDYDHNIVLPMPGYRTKVIYPCASARPVADSHTGFVVRKPDRKAVKEHMKLLQPRLDTARVVYEMADARTRLTMTGALFYSSALQQKMLFDVDEELAPAEYVYLYMRHLAGDITTVLNDKFMRSQVVPFLRIKE